MFKVFLLTILICISQLVSANTSVWVAHKDGATVYFGGTIHVLRNQDYPLPAEFEYAFEQADILTFETDIARLSEPKMQGYFIQALSYQDDRTIKSTVTPDTFEKLNTYLTNSGMSINFFRKAKPGFLMSVLTIAELQKIGVTQKGIDAYFESKAKNKKLPIQYFETPEEQVAFLAELGEGKEDEFYVALLADIKETQNQFMQMLYHWRNGETEALDKMINLEMKKKMPEMHDSLLVKRNNQWLPTIESYFKTPEVEYVLVGAAHLIGEDGIIEQLKRKGYQVSQVKVASAELD